MLLAVLPCHCNVASIGDNKASITALNTQDNSDDFDGDIDICTPFCSCSNIHYPNFVSYNKIKIQPIIVYTTSEYTTYRENHTSALIQNYWRPPQA